MLSLPSHLVLVLLVVLDLGSAMPRVSVSRRSPAGVSLPLTRRKVLSRSVEETAAWARRQREHVLTRYSGSKAKNKRSSSGTNELVNANHDTSYYGSLAVGTPATAYSVILDTGSSDLWLASSSCTSGCKGSTTFDSSTSSSFQNLSTTFKIQYGSGSAVGTLGQDIVQMAGFQVSPQKFGVVTGVTSGLLPDSTSGLLGLGFQGIASSGATPFWQTLVEEDAWDEPVMSFYLTRFINATNANNEQPGGRFTMGFTDNTLYTGDIEYTSISGDEGYWILDMTSLTVNDNAISLGTTTNSGYSAIDTGTTLIGGPSDVVAQIYEAIPGSAAGTGDYEGYYFYPCDTTVNISISFGGKNWTIDPVDFQAAHFSQHQCIGAIFATDASSVLSWVLGDAFLKNVYSVFRSSPPSVGFASLSETALAIAVVDGTLPSQTIGADPVTATAKSAGQLTGHSSVAIAISIALLTLFIHFL